MSEVQLNETWLRAARKPWFKSVVFFMLGFAFLIQCEWLALGFGPALSGLADFKQLYVAGYMVRTGEAREIYSLDRSEFHQTALTPGSRATLPSFNHLAFEALLFVPFSLMGYKGAYLAFLFFNLLLYGFICAQLRPDVAVLGALWKPLVYMPFTCFLPLALALVQGQDSILLLAVLVWSHLRLAKGQHVLAGAILALGMFKFQFVLPIVFLYFLWRNWLLVSGFFLGSGIVLLISLCVTGVTSWKTYVGYLLSISFHLRPSGRAVYTIFPELMANLRGAISTMADSRISPLAVQALIGVASLALIAWATRQRPSISLALTVSFLVSYHAYRHDALILLLPIALSARKFLSSVSVLPLCATGLLLLTPTLFALASIPFWLFIVPVLLLLAALAGRANEFSPSLIVEGGSGRVPPVQCSDLSRIFKED